MAKNFRWQDADQRTETRTRSALLQRKIVEGQRGEGAQVLGVMGNWAHAHGNTTTPNPTRIMRGLKVNEKRGVYVEHSDPALVYMHACDVIRDCRDTAYLTGQRSADVRKIKWSQLKDNALGFKQSKTGAVMRIAVIGELAEVVARIRRVGRLGLTILTAPNGQPLKEAAYFQSQFDKARGAAEADAKERGMPFFRVQFRDVRLKSATDPDDLKEAHKLLGHTTQRMRAKDTRSRKGDLVQPLIRKKTS